MSLIVKDPGSVPQERWQYPVAATGFTVTVPSYGLLYGEVAKHCNANQVSAPSEQEVIDWVCRELSIECIEMTTRTPLVNRFTQGLPAAVQPCCGSR